MNNKEMKGRKQRQHQRVVERKLYFSLTSPLLLEFYPATPLSGVLERVTLFVKLMLLVALWVAPLIVSFLILFIVDSTY